MVDSNVTSLFELEKPVEPVKVEKTIQAPLLEAEDDIPNNVLPKKLESYDEMDAEDTEDWRDLERFEPPKSYSISPDWFIENKLKGARYQYIQDLKADLMTLRGQITFILNEFPETRNSDEALEYQILKTFYGVNFTRTFGQYWGLKDRPSRDNVKRIRAWLNQKWYFIATDPEVAKARQRLDKVYANIFSGKNSND